MSRLWILPLLALLALAPLGCRRRAAPCQPACAAPVAPVPVAPLGAPSAGYDPYGAPTMVAPGPIGSGS